MNEEGLRRILKSCKKYDVEETRDRAERALNSENAAATIRHSTDETLTWLIDSSGQLSIPLLQVVRTPVWIVPNPLVGVYAARTGKEEDIVVYEGTFQILAFVVFLWACIHRTQSLLEKAKLNPTDRQDVEARLHQVIAFAEPLCALRVRRPTRLPDLRAGLLPAETEVAAWFLVAAEVFMLLHEQAHVDLGHTKGKSGQTIARPQFSISEEVDDYMADEFEADRCAIELLPVERQGFVAFGAIWFLLSVLYHESLLTRLSVKHPLAINRMKAVLDRFGMSMRDSDRAFAAVLIESCREMMESGKRFSHVSESDKLTVMLSGQHPNYAAAFIEWFFPFSNSFLLQRS
jgi:hypothetical protein